MKDLLSLIDDKRKEGIFPNPLVLLMADPDCHMYECLHPCK